MYPFLDTSLSFEERAADLVSRLTPEEKVLQTLNTAPAIPRLGVKSCNYWNECLHGVARAGTATVFPQSIALAATFDPEGMKEIASVIGDEARAKFHEYQRYDDSELYKHLIYCSPNVNIFRDPRWGRGQETYGEDPYLSGRMGAAFIQGLQGDHPRYLKAVATAKHFAVHSGPEGMRHTFDAKVSKKDLYETYLPAFRATVVEGKVRFVMGAYNRVYGDPCCANAFLIEEILRNQWHFDGAFCSDSGAMDDIHRAHKTAGTPAEAAAISLKSGCDLNIGSTFEHLGEALETGSITMEMLDRALVRLFVERFRLGEFDPQDQVPYAATPYEVNDCPQHQAMNRETARNTFVLLKNENNTLPLKKGQTIAVIGPVADDAEVLLGNYNGRPNHGVTILEGIQRVAGGSTRILYAKGCELFKPGNRFLDTSTRSHAEALSAASHADAVVLCLGYVPQMEGEEGDAAFSDQSGDRTFISLPECQQALLEAVMALGKPTTLVLTGGSAVAIPWAAEHVPAILETWYPGGQGGLAVADVLFGHSPSGRLPVTFVRDIADLPPFEDYSMKNRTYRYIEKEPLFPFGFGLSYTQFAYSNLTAPEKVQTGEGFAASVTVRNVGEAESDEVVQFYLRDEEASVTVPHWSLCAMKRVHLKPGEETAVELPVPARQIAMVNEEGRHVVEPGFVTLYAGGSQPDARSAALGAAPVLSARILLEGEAVTLEY